MISLLEQAIRAAQALPETEQDVIAAAILAEIEDERRWADAFERSADAKREQSCRLTRSTAL